MYCRPMHACSAPSERTEGPCMLVRPHQNVLQAHACLFGPIRTYCRPMHACSAPLNVLQAHACLFGPISMYCRSMHACSVPSERTAGPCMLVRPHSARILPNFCVVLCIVCFVSFCVLFVCICVLYYCHRVATQLQFSNVSYQNVLQAHACLFGPISTY